MLKKNNYWDKRFLKLTSSIFNKAEEYYNELEETYLDSFLSIQEEIELFYLKYSTDNNISLLDAKRSLSKNEIKRIKVKLEEYTKVAEENNLDSEWIDEIEKLKGRTKINRLEFLNMQIEQEIKLLSNKRLIGLNKLAKEIYNDSYYKTIYELQQILGIDDTFNIINKNIVEAVIASPWTPDGSHFSERIWKDQNLLINNLKKELSHMFIRGEAPDRAIKNISKTMNTSKKAAGRLIMTESAFFTNAAKVKSFEELDVRKYMYSATLDLRTSEICQELDHQVFLLKDAMIGVNYPPMHPNCRSTVIPHFEGNIKERWARDPVTGKNTTVRNMSYKEWYKKYVENNEEALLNQKKLQNNTNDLKQYSKYKKVIDDDFKISFNKFVDIKYTNPELYNLYITDFKRRNKLLNNPELKLPNIEVATIDYRKFTEYLFGGKNENGLIKGSLITSKIGYNIDNYKEFKDEILERGKLYPATFKSTIAQGDRYETRTFFYTKDNAPVNVEIGWLVNGKETHMTSVYINEVKNNEN